MFSNLLIESVSVDPGAFIKQAKRNSYGRWKFFVADDAQTVFSEVNFYQAALGHAVAEFKKKLSTKNVALVVDSFTPESKPVKKKPVKKKTVSKKADQKAILKDAIKKMKAENVLEALDEVFGKNQP